DSAVQLPFIVKEHSADAAMLGEILREYFDQVNFGLAIAAAGGKPAAAPAAVGGREAIEGGQPFTRTQYFTIAIGAMCGLFMGATIGERTGAEKREQVFNRVILSNSRPLHFLMGKTAAAFCLIGLQFA